MSSALLECKKDPQFITAHEILSDYFQTTPNDSWDFSGARVACSVRPVRSRWQLLVSALQDARAMISGMNLADAIKEQAVGEAKTTLLRQMRDLEEAEKLRKQFEEAERKVEEMERAKRQMQKVVVVAKAAEIVPAPAAEPTVKPTAEPAAESTAEPSAELDASPPAAVGEDLRAESSGAVAAVRAMFKQLEVGGRLSHYTANSFSKVNAGVDLARRVLWWEPEHRTQTARRSLEFAHVKRLWWGRAASPTFALYERAYFGLRDADELCFSLECAAAAGGDGSRSYWLDFAAADHMQLKLWFLGLQALSAKPGGGGPSAAGLADHLQHGLGLQAGAAVWPEEAEEGEEDDAARESRVERRLQLWMKSGELAHFARRFDLGRWMRWCFAEAAKAPGGGGGKGRAVAVLLLSSVQEMLDIAATEQIRLAATAEDFNALRRLHTALLPAARSAASIDFMRFTAMLTTPEETEDAAFWARPGKGRPSTTRGPVGLGPRRSAHPDTDISALADAGLRLGDRIEVRMPVGGSASRSKWMWQECRLAARGSGRYFPHQAEQFQAAVAGLAAMSADGSSKEAKDEQARAVELERFLDRHA